VKRLNLQVCVPYVKCPFGCPTCIATDNNKFKDLYHKNRKKYFEHLTSALKKCEGDIIITGATEPTLDQEWLTDVVSFIRDNFFGRKIEIQTHNLKWLASKEASHFDVVSFSATNEKDLSAILLGNALNTTDYNKLNYTLRVVILATRENYLWLVGNPNIKRYIPQITIKDLQLTKNEDVNNYINIHKYSSSFYENLNFNTDSLRIDKNCQDSEFRYRVFREDGKLYRGWR